MSSNNSMGFTLSFVRGVAIAFATTIPLLGCDSDKDSEKEQEDSDPADTGTDASTADAGTDPNEAFNPAYEPAVLEEGQLELPLPTGSYRVGLSQRMMTKGEELPTEMEDSIAIYEAYFVRIFFPIDPGYKGETFKIDISLVPCSKDEQQVLTHSYRNVGIVPGDERFPVVLFAPAAGAPINNYVSLLEDLASQGYIVAAFQPEQTFPVAMFNASMLMPDFCDGEELWRRYVEVTNSNFDQIASQMISVVDLWRKDASYVLDQLVQLDKQDPAGILTGRLDLEKVGMFGHSLGGATAHEACATDPRFKACENLDGNFYGQNADTPLSSPLMIQLSSLHNDGKTYLPYISEEVESIDKTLEPTWDAVTLAPGYRIVISDIAHNSFMDTNLMEKFFIWNETLAGDEVCIADKKQSVIDQCATKETLLRANGGTLDPVRAIEISNAYTRAFFNKHLKGTTQNLLDGPSAAYPEVTFEAKP